jgi:hypothetical protein
MNTSSLVRQEESPMASARLNGRKPVAMAIIAALCLSLGSPSVLARIKIDPGDGPVGEIPPDPVPPVPVATPTPAAAPSYAAWTHAHGDADNSGFAKVVTAPAVSYSAIADVGPLAPGANPVTGKDSTVYIGNLNGELIALHPDGTPFWKRKLEGPNGLMLGAIHASPVVGDDGSIYVVSALLNIIRDHGNGTDVKTSLATTTYLHKFTAGGGWVGYRLFPANDYQGSAGTAATTAPPSIWRFNGAEAVMVPVYKGPFLHLIAFSTGGLGLLADQLVTPVELTGGSGSSWWDDLWSGNLIDQIEAGCVVFPVACVPLVSSGTIVALNYVLFTNGSGFSAPTTPSSTPFDVVGTPGVAIRQNSTTQPPHIFVVDGLHDTVEYLFDINSGFRWVQRTHNDERTNLSPPVALATGGIVIGKHTPHESLGGISFEPEQHYLWLDSDIVAAPTVTPNGRIAVVSNSGWLTTVLSGNLEKQEWHNGRSIASAASSCTHLFVAAENELITYDLSTMQWVNRLPWTDGGLHSTVIGPAGHVYATTEHGIYVFPPEPNRDPKNVAGTQCNS